MSAKVLLFLSSYRRDSTPLQYACPDGSTVDGAQTNDAPVRYLLRAHPDVTELLCVVTPQAAEAAWENLQGVVAETAPQVRCVKIPFSEEESFEETLLPEVIEKTRDGDVILLDITGGFRNATTYLMLIGRALTYAGRRIGQAIYSSYSQRRIEDVSHLLGLFDLIGGMQELTSLGSAATLRTYYQGVPHPAEIDELLAALDQLWEEITLCRANRIAGAMERFNSAMAGVRDCDDPMMRALFPAFRKKFGSKLTTPGMIKWCVQSGMLQQALTFYVERVPAHILQNTLFVTSKVYWVTKPELLKSYEDADTVQFVRGFLSLSNKLHDEEKKDSYRVYLKTLQSFEQLVLKSGYDYKCTLKRLKEICMDYLYIKQLRNMTNHANTEGSTEQEALVAYLVAEGYKPLEETTRADVAAAILKGLKNLQPQSRKERLE